MNEGLSRDEAIQVAIKHCIEVNVLRDFLKENYEEVANMLNIQYDKEEEFQAIREEVTEEVTEKVTEEVTEDNIGKTISILRNFAIDDDLIAEQIKEEFKLSNEEVHQFL